MNSQDILKFIELVTRLKHISRKGWENSNIPNHEPVAGHMYAMAMMTFLIDESFNLNQTKCMQLALLHDLAESIVGDVTPKDNIPPNVKRDMEMEAMKTITNLLGKKIGGDVMELYKEYEDRNTPEAVFVKDLDMFDMIFTADYYEKREREPFKLEEFFKSTEGKFKHPFMIKLVEELRRNRELSVKNLQHS